MKVKLLHGLCRDAKNKTAVAAAKCNMWKATSPPPKVTDRYPDVFDDWLWVFVSVHRRALILTRLFRERDGCKAGISRNRTPWLSLVWLAVCTLVSSQKLFWFTYVQIWLAALIGQVEIALNLFAAKEIETVFSGFILNTVYIPSVCTRCPGCLIPLGQFPKLFFFHGGTSKIIVHIPRNIFLWK